MIKKNFLLALLLCTFSLSAMANVVYVDSSQISGIQNGANWATAFSNFQSGINAANAGDSVWVAKGNYQLDSGEYFTMKEGVKIFGGFLNIDTNFVQRNFTLNVTLLTGGINIYGVINNSNNNLTSAALLDGFKISGNNSTYRAVRGIYNYNVSPSFRNLVIINNKGDYGGGIYNYNSNPILTNVTITDNVSSLYGGGIYNDNSELILTNVDIIGNTANNGGGGIYNANGSSISLNFVNIIGNSATWGGGLSSQLSQATLSNVVIMQNDATEGGGMENDNTNATLDHVIITENTVSGYYCSGGGMSNSGGLITLNDVTISENIADASGEVIGGFGGGLSNGSSIQCTNVRITNNLAIGGSWSNTGLGGGIYNSQYPATFTNVIIAGNKAVGQFSDSSGSGGGMYSYAASLYFQNVLFNGNLASGGYGGGLYFDNGLTAGLQMIFTNVTISSNKANTNGGGLAIENIYSSELKIRNSIIYGNNIEDVYNVNTSALPEYRFSLIGGLNNSNTSNYTNYNNIDGVTDPKFINPVTATSAPTTMGNYKLQGNSPVINMGDSSYNTTNTDLAGGVRIFNSSIDMGAYEYQPPIVNLGNDTSICSGIPLVLDAQNEGASFIWNTGDTTQIIIVDTSGMYVVAVTNTVGTRMDTINVIVHLSPIVNLGNDTFFCLGNSITLDAQNLGDTYFWNNMASTQTISVNSTGNYSVTVTDANGCAGTDEMHVSVTPLLTVNLGNDTTLAVGATIILNADNPGTTYLWNTGETTQNISVTKPGNYFVTVTNTNGCIGTDTIIIKSNTVGINDINKETSAFSVTPNPTKDIVHINISDFRLLRTQAILTDTYGRVIKVLVMKSESEELSLAGLSKGIYILKLQNSQAVKLVKD